MKTIIMTVVVVGVMVALLNLPSNSDTTYVREEGTVEVQPVEEVVEVDVIEKARQELERINNELDVKEQELLEKRKSIDAELEKLRQTRTSFQ